MDLDSCFLDCCKNCSSTCQTHKSPASGQGDFKCSGEVSGDGNFLVNPERGKTGKNGKEKVEWKDEKRKKSWEAHTDCYVKNLECSARGGRRRECSPGVVEYPFDTSTGSKLRRSDEQEKTNFDAFEASHGTWDHHTLLDGCNSKMSGKSFNGGQESKDTQFLVQKHLQLEEKVDFLCDLFQHCDHKLSKEAFLEQSQTKAADATVMANIWQLLNLNKRMCAAEEDIQKLSEILKDLIKVSTKRKDSFSLDDELCCGSSVNFDELNIGQRINFLKNRNDLLTSFVVAFLGSVNEICSRLALLPKEEPSMNSKIQGKDQHGEQDPDEVLDTFRKLKIPFNDVQEKKTLSCRTSHNHNQNRVDKINEHCGLKFSGNKLEVISEQAEFAANRIVDTSKVIGEIKKNTFGKNLKGKFSQVSTEGRGKGVEVSDSTSRLLAQEAVLRSSLDQVHLGLFSKLDSAEKKTKLTNLLDISRNSDSKIWESDSNLGSSSSEDSCANYEVENTETSAAKSAPQISNKRFRVEELRDAIKEEKSVGSNANRVGCKSGEDQSDGNTNKSSRKVLHKSSYILLADSQKSKGNLPSPRETCSSAQGRWRAGEAAGEQRPLTAPSSQRKPLLPRAVKPPPKTCLKSASPPEGKKRNSALANNVKYKNKVLVSKKSFVRTQP